MNLLYIQEVLIQDDVTYHRISVKPKNLVPRRGRQKVMFADSTEHNWCYHDRRTNPYITGYSILLIVFHLSSSCKDHEATLSL